MVELRQFVRRYLNGEISYSTFRREFVTRFLTVRTGDQVIDAAIVEIESLCADVAEQTILSEAELRIALGRIVRPQGTTNVSAVLEVLLDLDFRIFSQVTATAVPTAASSNLYPSTRNPLSSSRDPFPDQLTVIVNA